MALRQQIFYHFAVDIGQTEVSTSISVGEIFVIETEQVENGGVEIVDVDGIFDGFEAEIVGLAVLIAAADAATCHPHSEAVMIVIATEGGVG